MALFFHPVLSRRDDAALPHELVIEQDDTSPQQGQDDGQDGNSTPNGGQ